MSKPPASQTRYDYAFGRFGTMFFANPVVALRNVRQALRPGGRLNMVVWRRKLDNDWLHRAETLVEQFLDRPEEYDAPTCGPGPFSMANADTVTDVLKHAGFEHITLKRQDLMIKTGEDAGPRRRPGHVTRSRRRGSAPVGRPGE